jgi:replication factor A1
MKSLSLSETPHMKTGYHNLTIGQLTNGMKNLTIRAHIVKIPPGKGVMTRWGGQACISNATIADETGTIRLSLWNNQITSFNVGDEIDITKCYVTRFAGELQVRVTRKGSVSISPSIEQDLKVPIPLAS